jgi:sarcosine oxidase subunit alpha
MAVGEIRNAILANDEGIIFDDSHIVRLASHRYLLVTTTAAAAVAGAMIERYLQIEWPALEVFSTPVTTQWAMMSLAGPLSGEVLRKIHPASRLDDIGPMTAWQGRLEGVAARILRISYTGERAYEIMVPAAAAPGLWDRIRRAGRSSGLELFGLEALDTLRIEKGFFHIGVETDGMTIPDDLSDRQALEHGSLGQRSFARRRAQEGERLQLVGLLTEDARTRLPVGAEISKDWKSPSEGHVTSSVDSPLLRRPIALAMLASGRSRHGERLLLQHGEKSYSARVTEPCFHDLDGSRL